jgi:hypothetical protein
MEYFAGLDVSLAGPHVYVVTRDGAVMHEVKVPSTPADIAAALAQVPACRRVLFETGRMAPMLYHGLSRLGLPVVCVESRQAYQALKSLATHKTDRDDARGLAHLARTGFFKPVHVKSLPAHAVRSCARAPQSRPLAAEVRGLNASLIYFPPQHRVVLAHRGSAQSPFRAARHHAIAAADRKQRRPRDAG